ncbi:LemA family protein [Candidatus Gracilibacteria bacterium]|nr:LemA family protein [Candidatus Gracilibacteria bacterium]
MMLYAIIFGIITILLCGGWIYFYTFSYKLKRKEQDIRSLFFSRTDNIVSIYEITLPYLEKHSEIFKEILSLRKKEFTLSEISEDIEAFFELESRIHHELNFIFQVCNTHPRLLKDKKFLYVRDILLDKSSLIGKNIAEYNEYIKLYNTMVRYKQYSVIGLLLPFNKKKLLR